MEKSMTMHKTKSMVFAALFAALACVATMSLHIPTPGTGGYIHPGDAIVVLSCSGRFTADWPQASVPHWQIF